MLTVGLAVVVLALVAVGLRAAAGRSQSDDVVEVPARRSAAPPASSPSSSSPSTTGPGRSSSTTLPGAAGTTVPGAGRLKVTDSDGRFEITIPRTWVNIPAIGTDQTQWVPFVQGPSGELVPSPFVFAVRWSPSGGCALEACAAQVVDRMRSAYPGVTPTAAPESIAGRTAVRIEATTADERLVAWVIVEGDRYWVPQLRGPPDGFGLILTAVRTSVASMSFG